MSGKIELRQAIREKLLQLDPVQAEQNNAIITKQFLATQGFMPHSNIACYMPLKGEISCVPIIQTLISQGHVICLPAVLARDTPLIFRYYRLGDPLVRGILGPFEPNSTAREIIPDVLVIPMLGYTRDGYRLGYGSGFYDRTIALMQQSKPIKTIGLAFSAQEIEQFPVEPHDMKLDVIITEKEVIQTS